MSKRLLLCLCLVCALLFSAAAASAHGEADIIITNVWARPTVGAEMATAESAMGMAAGEHSHGNHAMGSTTPSAAYMQIENRGEHPIALVAVASPVSMMAQIHQTTITDNVARMSEVEGGIEIAAGETAVLQPGSFHIMLMSLTQDLVPGSAIALDLTFEMRETDAEPMTVTVAALVTDLPLEQQPLTLVNARLFSAEDESIPDALEGIALPEGLLAFARLENRGDADAPLASASFLDAPAALLVLVDGALYEIDEYDIGVGETVEIVVALGEIAADEIATGALPFMLLLSDDTTLALAAPLAGMAASMHDHDM